MSSENLHAAESTLRKVSLFMDFDAQELDTFMEFADTVRVRRGETAIRQGEMGSGMFIVMEGTLAAKVRLNDGQEHIIQRLQSGDFFGELSVLEEYPRSADVEATSDCVLLKITGQVVETFFQVQPGAAFKILLAVCRDLKSRLRESDRRYLDFLRSEL